MLKHDNCKDCHSKCEHAGKDREFVIPRGRESCKKKVLTNYERIKAMSIDEMAEFMFRMVDCVSCQNKLMNNGDFRGTKKCNDKDFYAMCNGDGTKCFKVCKEWLESEVSEKT